MFGQQLGLIKVRVVGSGPPGPPQAEARPLQLFPAWGTV